MQESNFGNAIEELKAGRKVWRKGWNGKGMWLVLVGGWDIPNEHDYKHYADIDDCETIPWIGMKTAQDQFVPWTSSQSDMLAEDWCSDRIF
jgi:hypothetical protein